MKKSFREEYLEEYQKVGNIMFEACEIPTVYDFALAFKENNEDAYNKIKTITDFTGNLDDIIASCNRTYEDYDDKASIKFIDSVIASNVTEIINSGMMYKYCMANCDDIKIVEEDCGSQGQTFELPISLEDYQYFIQDHFIMELNEYTEDYEDFLVKTKSLKTISVRNVSDCQTGNRNFCAKCCGKFRRSKESEFVPKNVGLFATLMVTEKATQASLDSMNKGKTTSVNSLLDTKLEVEDREQAKEKIREILAMIDISSGVQSRFYEMILWGRYRDNQFYPLRTSFLRDKDVFGQFIYNPKSQLKKLITTKKCALTSTKSRIAFNEFETDTEEY